ncbi:MAG: hypothetical protein QF645_11845, partial [Planctomycetota bacterium]|nr:hypothetical protein [Planctomycetota bacterium]
MNWLLLAAMLQVDVTPQEEIPITITGSSRIEYLHRTRPIPKVRAALNTPVTVQSESLFRSELELSLEADLGKEIRAGIGLKKPAWEEGEDIEMDSDLSENILIEELYVHFENFLMPELQLRFGTQDFAYSLRPGREPFFLGTPTSESFFAGTSTFVRNTADRDYVVPMGVSLLYNPHLAIEIEFWAGTVIGEGSTTSDESMYGIFLNGLLSERTAWNLVSTLVTGEGSDREIYTIGFALDHYLTQSRSLELFFEFYWQFGSLDETNDRAATALAIGAAWYGDGWTVEGSYTMRSGDEDPFDQKDKTFQSYEDINQFAIIESASLGLDIDTNVSSIRLSATVDIFEHSTLRFDIGYFHFLEKVRNSSGFALAPSQDLGTEIDLTLEHHMN